MVHRYLNKMWKQIKVPDIKMHKTASPEPHRKEISILSFQPAWINQFPTGHSCRYQVQNVVSERRFERKTDLKEVIYGQSFGLELKNLGQILLSLLHSSLTTASEKLWHQQETWEKKKGNSGWDLEAIAVIWKDHFCPDLEVLDKAWPPFNY